LALFLFLLVLFYTPDILNKSMAETQQNSFSSIPVEFPTQWKDYSLLDSGNGFKLEKFGSYRLIRPEAEAVWSPKLKESEWQKVDAIYKPSQEENGGHWEFKSKKLDKWQLGYSTLKFEAQLSGSRHVGVFPEQACQWDWADKIIHASNRKPKVLNLFGYTGLASLAAAAAGASVTHVDASKKVVLWAKENQNLSRIDQSTIRWIVDDAVKFVQREARRGSSYDGIILDPPKFGRGPKGEVWEFYKLLPSLLSSCREVLSTNPLFIQLTAYAVKASAITLQQAMAEMMVKFGGITTCGEIGLLELSGERFLSTAIFARWQNS
jgi:23S rRNA (cytosine1962-C5)-methyltransferase